MSPKYTYVNGIPVINPQYENEGRQAPASSIANNGTQLAVVSTVQDQAEMAALTQVAAPTQIQNAIMTMQSPAYIQGFNATGINEDTLVDGLSGLFQKYEIPLGLMSKLIAMQGMKLHFKIDDSGSMNSDSNLLTRDISPYMIGVVDPNKRYVTRWQEAQDRLHVLIEILAYVPTGPIKLSFFDHADYEKGSFIILDRTGKTPAEFLVDAHTKISRLFGSHSASRSTPILLNLTHMFNEANVTALRNDVKTMHYLLTDGEPNGGAGEIDLIKNLLVSQSRNADNNPLTILGCSNQRRDYAWMHEMEEIAKSVAALPDFQDELADVMRDQGPAFPYTRGFWLLCNIAAAINPDDLDAMDHGAPLAKNTLQNLLGRGLVDTEYARYFNSHPKRYWFEPDFQAFTTVNISRDIASVQLFNRVLAKLESYDMDQGNDDSEDYDTQRALAAVLNSRSGVASSGMFRQQPVRYNNNPQTTEQPAVCCTMM